METRWILGLGPVIVDDQFIKDIGRRSVHWYLNNKPLSKDPRDALLRIYENCGNKYYQFTKYISQTMGNMMYSHVHQMHWKGTMMQRPDTYIIRAYTNPNRVYASIHLDLYDEQLRRCGEVRVVSMIDLDTDQTRISVKRL